MAKNKSGMRGQFKPKNPEKYIGNANAIRGRSSWEFIFFAWLDSNPSVLKWSSEAIAIPYLSPIDGKVHKYYPDCIVVYQDKNGNLKREMVEIKPYNETIEHPRATPQQKLDIAVNHAKWTAAAHFCKSNNMEFRVITEKTLQPKKIKRTEK